jgi:hypothetical protein
MRELEKIDLLNVTRLPARLTAKQTADLLNFELHDIPILIKHKLLKPLGNPAPNGHKWFSAKEIQELASDEKWLSTATRMISRHWKVKNEGNLVNSGE